MPTYEEVLGLAKRLPPDEQSRLLSELVVLIGQSVEVEGSDEKISPEEIAESEAAWQEYRAGRDEGVSADELKRQLFGKTLG
jgi:hypothetical protein